MASAFESAPIPTGSAGAPGHLSRLIDRAETIRFLTSSNLKAGHRNKVLGNVWNLLDPLLLVCVYFLVFGLLFGQTDRARPRSAGTRHHPGSTVVPGQTTKPIGCGCGSSSHLSDRARSTRALPPH